MIEVKYSGFHSCIQDFGRLGQQAFGVPIGGAMDQNAMQWANRLLNNSKDCAVLEMSFKGPKLVFHQSTTIALAGADMDARLNKKPIQNLKPIEINENDVLQFGNAHHGKRTYLAVAGGFQTPLVLGSRSQYKGITPEGIVLKTKLIPFHQVKVNSKKGVHIKIPHSTTNQKIIPVYKGPEFDLLSAETQNFLGKNSFTISIKNSRMAYVLEEKINSQIPSMWTAPVLPGTVQCTPNGTLIILMRDAQTTGGYPRLLQVSDEGLNLLAQKSTKDHIQFQLIPI
jgi:biotin-dependent carboxylase-like uncharacterized protein